MLVVFDHFRLLSETFEDFALILHCLFLETLEVFQECPTSSPYALLF